MGRQDARIARERAGAATAEQMIADARARAAATPPGHVTYRDQYGDRRTADIGTDPEYDPADLWEGVDYEGRDVESGLPVTLNWEHNEGWSQNA